MFDFNTDTGIIRAYGVIGDFVDGISETDFMEALDAMGGRDVTIHLNSEGGVVSSGLSIHNQLQFYDGKVTVEVDAQAASIASVLMLGADEINASANATVMVHRVWAVATGNAADFRSTAEIMEKLDMDVAGVYAQRTGKSDRYWFDKMSRNGGDGTYMAAQEALEEGLIDGIRAGKKSKKKAQAAEKMAPVAMIAPAFSALQNTLARQKMVMRHQKNPHVEDLTGPGPV